MTQVKVFMVALVAMLAGVVALGSLAVRPALAEAAYVSGDISLGAEDAPVTVIEYASMTCPHCATFHIKTFKAFKEKYIDTGKVRFTFREFPFDQDALRASMLARCSGEERYFGMLDLLFRQQFKWAGKENSVSLLAQLVRFSGMSKETVESCLANETLMNEILQTRMIGHQKNGVDSTPTFLVNGDKFTGAIELPEWDDILAKYLK
tara:strand:- start:1064 stop:1684 length:621 start_codon:yes stop_codon:yes gene_type:complete